MEPWILDLRALPCPAPPGQPAARSPAPERTARCERPSLFRLLLRVAHPGPLVAAASFALTRFLADPPAEPDELAQPAEPAFTTDATEVALLVSLFAPDEVAVIARPRPISALSCLFVFPCSAGRTCQTAGHCPLARPSRVSSPVFPLAVFTMHVSTFQGSSKPFSK